MLLIGIGTQTLMAQEKALPDQKNPYVVSFELNPEDSLPQNILFSADAPFRASDEQTLFHQFLPMQAGRDELRFKNATATKQGTVVDRYDQYYKHIKVDFGSYIVMLKNGAVSFLAGKFYRMKDDLSPVPVLSEAQALDAALLSVGATKYAWQDSSMQQFIRNYFNKPDTTYLPAGRLVWMEDLSGEHSNGELHLAYAFDISAMEPMSREEVYVDAQNGHLLFSNNMIHHVSVTGSTLYSGNIPMQTNLSGATYVMNDLTRGNGVHTWNMNNGTNYGTATEISSASNTWTTAAVANDAHWGAEMVYDYWHNVQGRNSYDNANAIINSYVHYSTNYDNAYWNGTVMTYGDGSGIANGGFSPLGALDVCAHEIGHAVMQYTANLAYQKESGAMNEGFSDIWGCVIENYADPHETDAMAKSNYSIGEEIYASPLRWMNTPKLGIQPDTYGGSFWVSQTCTPSSGNDYCGVHTNSGVLNYWFYLISHGGSGTNDLSNAYSVVGIGMTEAANIVYQTELSLTSAATYANCRTTSISVATTLYGACSPEVEAVTRAWYAVGVGANFVACTSRIGFAANTGTFTENASTNSCTASHNVNIPVNVWGLAPSGGNPSVTIAATGGTAVSGVNYTLVTTSLTFTAGSTASQNVVLTIYDNGTIGDTKDVVLTLTFSANGSSTTLYSQEASTDITIQNDDNAPANATTVSTQVNLFNGATNVGSPFQGSFRRMHSEYLWKASELSGSGILANTPISALAMYVSTKASTQPYTSFTISIGNTATADLNTAFVTGLTQVYSANYSTVAGWNTFNFSSNFNWDGTSNVVIEFCFTNTSSTSADNVYGFTGTYVSNDVDVASTSGTSGCLLAYSTTNKFTAKPIIKLTQTIPATGIETTNASSRTWNVKTGQEVYFYNNSNGNLIAGLKNSSADLGCTTASLNAAGNGFSASSFDATVNRSLKEFAITPTTNASTASYTATLYLTTAELAGVNPSTLNICKTDEPTDATITRLNSQLATPTVTAGATYTSFAGNFNSFSRFFLVNGALPHAATVTPGSATTFCSGNSVTLNASPTTAGLTYQWLLNGSPIGGATSSSYSATASGNYKVAIANAAVNGFDTSAVLVVTVNPNVTPAVSISPSANNICSGTGVVFTATPANGGGAPAYNFKVNGVSVQSGSSATYSSSAFANSDAVTCVMTANNTCQTSSTANSNSVSMTVNANVTPGVSIGADNNNICSGTAVNFTATPGNGGSAPVYNFKINGSSVQNGSSNVFSSTTLANGNAVTCVMTANNTCQTSPTANSNTVSMVVNTTVTPSVSISASPGTAAAPGQNVTFTATPTNGGSTPAYQWKKNGMDVGTNSTGYSDNTLADADVISCIMTGNATCSTSPTATSNSLNMAIGVLDDFRTIASGNWGTATNWQRFNGAAWVAAPAAPDYTRNNITVRTGHTMNVTTSVTVDQVTVQTGAILQINNGSAPVFTVNDDGTAAADLLNQGTVTLDNANTISGNGYFENTTGAVFQWGAGTMNGSGETRFDAGSNPMLGTGTHTVSGTRLLNNYSASFTWSAGNMDASSGSPVLQNYGTLTFTPTTNVQLMSSGSSTGSLVNESGAIFNVSAGSSSSVTMGNNAFTFVNHGTLNVNSGSFNLSGTMGQVDGTVVVAANATLGGSATLNFDGPSVTNNGTISIASLVFTSHSTQAFNGTGSISTLSFNGGGGVTLGGDQTITGALQFLLGVINLGSHNLILSGSAGISGANSSSYAEADASGTLQRQLGAGETKSFPVGTVDSYLPVTVSLHAGSVTDLFKARVLDAFYSGYDSNDNPLAIATSNDYVNRTWIVSEGTPGGSDADLTIQWNASDEGAAFNRNYSHFGHYHNNNWDLDVQMAASGSGPYTLTRNHITSFSPFGDDENGGVLPVTLASFNGKTLGQVNVLDWTTLSEINTNNFDLERSADGIHFRSIGQLKAAGHSVQALHYSLTDEQPLAGMNYYRLRTNDLDHSIHYSEIVGLYQGATGFGVSIFPNPSSGKIHVHLQDEVTDANIQVFDLQGRLQGSGTLTGKELDMDLGNLPAGVYMMQVQSGSKRFLSKLIIQQ